MESSIYSSTRIVYADADVEYRMEDGAFSVRAKADLDVGRLVLVEHVFSGSNLEMHALMFLDGGLRRALYPRCDVGSSDEAAAGDSEKNAKKISMNAFDFRGDMVIGDRICKFNHACKPNSYLSWADNVDGVKFYGVWTVAKVRRGDELTLDYTNGYAHAHDGMKAQHGFACSCTPEVIARARARAKIELGLASKFARAHRDRTNGLVDAHLQRHGKAVSKAQSAVREFARNNIRTA